MSTPNTNEIDPMDAINTYPIKLELPKSIKRELLSCYRINSFIYPSYHPIWDNNCNTFLSEKLGIVTDCPIYNLNDEFLVFFDWNNQIWYVG